MVDTVKLHRTLSHAVTVFDTRQSKKKFYNHYALSLYLGRVNDVCDAVEAGTSLGRALYDNFNDRLLTALEKTCGLPVTYGGGGHDKGRPD